MRILFVSTHAFLPSTRKTSVHFVSEALARQGHAVATISVGYSQLTRLKNPDLVRQFASQQNRFVERYPGYRSACYLPLLHPFSAKNRLVNKVTGVLFRLYGNMLPRFMRDEVSAADVIVVESGTAICFFDAIRRANRTARIVYFKRDRLDTVGASQFLIDLEQRIAPAFDRVFVPSLLMAEQLPSGTKAAHLPQGIDKASFDRSTASPYAPGSRNAISVGNMLFDGAAVGALARHAPDVTFHLFGGGISGDFPANVRVYGERAFNEIIPYIKFADFALAPYRLSERDLYLAQSSLKLQQYSYCLLPILAPDLLAGARANVIGYRQSGEDDWAGLVQRALAVGRDPAWRADTVSWDEVAAEIEADCFPRIQHRRPSQPVGRGRELAAAN